MIGAKINSAASYSTYRTLAIESKSYPVKKAVYQKVMIGFIKFMVDKMFDGYDIILSPNLGTIAIRCRKVVPRLDYHGNVCGVAPSWAKTKVSWMEKAKEMGLTFEEWLEKVPKEDRQLVYCFNEHSNGLRYGLMWYKRTVTVRNKIFYSLNFCRAVKRRLHKAVLAGAEYTEIAPKVSSRAVDGVTGLKLRGRLHSPTKVEVIDDD